MRQPFNQQGYGHNGFGINDMIVQDRHRRKADLLVET